LVVQVFLKVPAAHALAPTQKEPPFLVVQLIVMALFVVLGIFAVKKFHN
jgi:flagellar biogenesis protein FliO